MAVALTLCVVTAGLILHQTVRALGLFKSARGKGAILTIGTLTALLGCTALYVELVLPEATVAGELAQIDDQVALDAGGGLLEVSARLRDGVPKDKFSTLSIRLMGRGANTKQIEDFSLQIGETREADRRTGSAPPQKLSQNLRLVALGEGAVLSLRRLAPADLVTLTVAFHPDPLPMQWVLWLLVGLTAAGGLVEGAGQNAFRRTFLTATLAGLTALAWLAREGLSADETTWDLALWVGYAAITALVLGTVLPSLAAMILPSGEKPEDTTTG